MPSKPCAPPSSRRKAQDSVTGSLDSTTAAANPAPVEAAGVAAAPADAAAPSQLNGAGAHAEAPQAEPAPTQTQPSEAAPSLEPEGERLAAPQVEKTGG